METLKAETNTPEIEKRVLAAFKEWWGTSPVPSEFQASFERGQWWVIDFESGAQWSVWDATEGVEEVGAVDGFVFEQVTGGKN